MAFSSAAGQQPKLRAQLPNMQHLVVLGLSPVLRKPLQHREKLLGQFDKLQQHGIARFCAFPRLMGLELDEL